MRIYVAGASKEPDRVRWAMHAVREAGHEITLDWLAAIERAGAANDGLSDGDRRNYAADDLWGVERADLVWLLAPEHQSAGAWVELGYAIAVRDGSWRRRQPLIVVSGPVVSGPARMRCIFAALANYESDHDEQALAWILARRGL